jgi:hypothetical protein
MNRRDYIWKIGVLAVVMVAVAVGLLSCSRESIEEAMEEGTLSAPLISVAASSLDSLPTSVTISLSDGSSYYIELVSPVPDAFGDIPPSGTWCYYVEEVSGPTDLSYWMLLVGSLTVSSSPPGSGGYDDSTGQYGIKWDTPETFTSGTFCITLGGICPATIIEALVKGGTNYNTRYIAGPASYTTGLDWPMIQAVEHNGNGQGNGGTP